MVAVGFDCGSGGWGPVGTTDNGQERGRLAALRSTLRVVAHAEVSTARLLSSRGIEVWLPSWR